MSKEQLMYEKCEGATVSRWHQYSVLFAMFCMSLMDVVIVFVTCDVISCCLVNPRS